MDLNFLKYLGLSKKKVCLEVKPPNDVHTEDIMYKKVFLGGSIEMGKAEDWQKSLVNSLAHLPFLFYNPRRDDWDSTWEQKIDNPQFHEQVTWELDKLEQADIVVMYFAPNTLSPISLLELGLYARSNKLVVLCPDGFWRKGNVDIVCERYNIMFVESFSDLTDYLISEIKK